MEPSRPYQTGDDLSRVDWNATARTGKVHVKIFREAQRQQVFILIDPRVFWYSPYHSFRSVYATERIVRNRYSTIEVAATLAEIAFRERKEAGLLVAGSPVYLPSNARHRDITHFIAALLAYTETAQPPPLGLQSGQILFDEKVRKHLKPGVAVHWITPLPLEEMEAAERAVARYRSLGVELRLAKFERTHNLSKPVVSFGGGDRHFDWQVESWERDLREAEAIRRLTKLLEQTSGFITDPVWYWDRGAAARQSLQELSKPVSGRNLSTILLRYDPSPVLAEEESDPRVLRLIRTALEDLSGRSMALLVETAKMRGWAVVLRYLRAEKERLGQIYGSLVGLESHDLYGMVHLEIPAAALDDLLDFASRHAPNFSRGRVDPFAKPWASGIPAQTIDELSYHAARNLDGSPYDWLHKYEVKTFLRKTKGGVFTKTDQDRLRREIEGHFALMDHWGGEPSEIERVYRETYLSSFDGHGNRWKIKDPFGYAVPPGPWMTEWPFTPENSMKALSLSWNDSWRNWIGFPVVRAWLHDLERHPRRIRGRVEKTMPHAPMTAAAWFRSAWEFLNKPRGLPHQPKQKEKTPPEIKPAIPPAAPVETVSENKMEIIGATQSGVLSTKPPFDHWFTPSGLLPRLNKYFPRSFGINYHPQNAGYAPDSEFPMASFQIGGGQEDRRKPHQRGLFLYGASCPTGRKAD